MSAEPDTLGVGRISSPPVAIFPWVSLSGVSPTAQAIYPHLLAASDFRAPTTQAAKLVGLDLAAAEPYILELVEIGAVTRLPDGAWMVHETPPEGYVGLTAYSQLWDAPPPLLDELLGDPLLPARPKSPLERARAEFAKCAARKQLRGEIAAGMHSCATCGAVEDLTVDHIVALAVGGSNDMDNLRVLCRTCNCRKGIRSA